MQAVCIVSCTTPTKSSEILPRSVSSLNLLPKPSRVSLASYFPRMASEQDGPTPTKQLEPPGFMALNYGRRTPLSVILAHLVYGGISGAFYELK